MIKPHHSIMAIIAPKSVVEPQNKSGGAKTPKQDKANIQESKYSDTKKARVGERSAERKDTRK